MHAWEGSPCPSSASHRPEAVRSVRKRVAQSSNCNCVWIQGNKIDCEIHFFKILFKLELLCKLLIFVPFSLIILFISFLSAVYFLLTNFLIETSLAKKGNWINKDSRSTYSTPTSILIGRRLESLSLGLWSNFLCVSHHKRSQLKDCNWKLNNIIYCEENFKSN
jgi:hypothetical protein